MLLLILPGVDVVLAAAVHCGAADVVVKFAGPRTAVWVIDLAYKYPSGAAESRCSSTRVLLMPTRSTAVPSP